MPARQDRGSPAAEAERLDALRSLRILDTPPEASFDRIVRLASTLFGMPIALVSLLDENRQWFKARYGLEAQSTPRDIAFCNHTIRGTRPLVIPDARADPRFSDNPLVAGPAAIRFYAGAPLRAGHQHNVGTLCVIDTVAHADFDESRQRVLQDLADLVVERLEARAAAEALQETLAAQERTRADLARALAQQELLFREVHHRIKNNLQAICAILQVEAAAAGPESEVKPVLDAVMERISLLARIHRQLYTSPTLGAVDLRQELGALVTDLQALHGDRTPIVLQHAGEPLLVDEDRALHLCLLANELVVNSLKHAYPGDRRGSIQVSVDRDPAGSLRLQVRDDGTGTMTPGKPGVGTMLVEAITAQLEANLSVCQTRGRCVTVTVPAPASPPGGP